VNSIQDHYGNTITIAHDSSQRVTQVTSPGGRWIKFTYGSSVCSACITRATDSIGRTVNYAYDASSNLTQVWDANGGLWQYTYDSQHEMTSITDPMGIVYLQNQYDSNGRVITQTQADSSAYQFSYVAAGSLSSSTPLVTQATLTDPRGNVEQITFNGSGYVSTDTLAANASGLSQTTNYVRGTVCSNTGSNLVTSKTDALSRQTTYAYDCMGNMTSVTVLTGTSNAATTSFTYEPTFNQLASVTDPLQNKTNFAYDTSGNLTTVTDPLTHPTTLGYNTVGQVTSITDALQDQAQFSYDPTTHDLVGITDPAQNTTTRQTDGAGRLIAVIDPLGNRTQYQYDALNQLQQITDARQAVTAFSYDPNGNLLRVTDANNHATTYSYDNMDRAASRTDPLHRIESFQYDANGNLTRWTDRRGKVSLYNYDALNRLTSAQFGYTGPGSYESQITYTYDAGNRPTLVSDSIAGNITPQFDGRDRLTQETTPQGSVSYTYDLASRRTGMTVAGQTALAYTYDNANRLTQITQGGSTSVGFAYDNADRRTSLTLLNGITVSYGYDLDSRLTSLTYKNGNTTMGNLTYTYDADGRRTQMGGSYASVNLPEPVPPSTYDAANELLQWGSSSLTYDSNGSLAADDVNNYTWNARNQLTGISGGTTASFQYDAYGRRSNKTIAGTTTGFLYDGVNAVQELSGSTVIANMIDGGIDEIFQRSDSTGTYSLLSDALGSTVALTNGSGSLATQYTYAPFGATTSSGTASTNTSQYTGRENDGTGLYYYRARYYSPQLGRFISEDPIGFRGGINKYAYVGNSPLNYIDPYGKWPFYNRQNPQFPGQRPTSPLNPTPDPIPVPEPNPTGPPPYTPPRSPVTQNPYDSGGPPNSPEAEDFQNVDDLFENTFHPFDIPGGGAFIPPMINPCVLDPSLCGPPLGGRKNWI
jgi:RHS repeat-associated protein